MLEKVLAMLEGGVEPLVVDLRALVGIATLLIGGRSFLTAGEPLGIGKHSERIFRPCGLRSSGTGVVGIRIVVFTRCERQGGKPHR